MIVDWFKGRSQLLPDKIAVIDGQTERSYTYDELNQRAEKLAAYLLKQKIEVGDRVALVSKNSVAHLDFLFACTKIGAIFVPLNWRLMQEELRDIVKDCQPSFMAYSQEFATDVDQQGGEQNFINTESEAYEAIVSTTERSSFTSAKLPEEAKAVLIYTSGSTGRPKGAIISHRSLINNALYTIPSWNLTSHDCTIAITPMFHTAGLFSLVTPLLMAGGEVYIQPNYSTLSTYQIIVDYQPTHIFMVPTMYYNMLTNPEINITKMTSVKLFVSGGAPLPKAVFEGYASANLPLINSYGLTEVGPNNFLISPQEAREKPGCVGKPNILSNVKLVDENDRDVKVGEVGELLIAGNHAFKGYWNNQPETIEAFHMGYVRTGDYAKQDEAGDYYIIGRKKEMIISGGENVYPSEVEAILIKHPLVQDVIVVGYEVEKWGESVGAAVVLKQEEPNYAEVLQAYCAERLAVYKAPKTYMQLKEFPLTPVGKIDKKELVKQFEQLISK
ncbi:AMP-binding protein [Streptococcus uberis]|nr:AMP-binding protein [Streptococcus uberis]MCK1204314.1 AMP-binding protein [Streptococcus uberis]